MDAEEIKALNARFENESTEAILNWAWEQFGTRAAIGTSFQGAGLVMIHLAQRYGWRFPVFTIDTGLLFPETRALKVKLEGFFGIQIETLTPEQTVEQQAAVHGPELWKRDPDLCCTLRKVYPLRAKLATLDAWITGLRRQQAETRAQAGLVELHALDDNGRHHIVKLNPMARWTREAVWNYIQQHDIPYNPLHDRGYRSIGCQPCTALPGQTQNERAGRWIGFNKTECGIHTFMKREA